MTVRSVGLWFNHDPAVMAAAHRLLVSLDKKGLAVSTAAAFSGDARFTSFARGYDGCDVLLTLGGDGTLLRGCREAVARDIPIGGINRGHVGFLTSAEAGEEERVIDRLLAGDFAIEHRMTLSSDTELTPMALNDVTMTRAQDSKRILSVEVRVDGALVTAFSGDGMIVATPTGSTSYSLAAGGPIVSPDMALMLLTPVCPHALNARPMIVPDTAAVTLTVAGDSVGRLSVDGTDTGLFSEGQSVTVRRGRRDVRLLRFGSDDFYSRFRTRLTGIR